MKLRNVLTYNGPVHGFSKITLSTSICDHHRIKVPTDRRTLQISWLYRSFGKLISHRQIILIYSYILSLDFIQVSKRPFRKFQDIEISNCREVSFTRRASKMLARTFHKKVLSGQTSGESTKAEYNDILLFS